MDSSFEALVCLERCNPLTTQFQLLATLLPATGGRILASVAITAALRCDAGRIWLAGLLLTAHPAPISAQPAGSFAPTGSMGGARSFHTATLLSSGKVLIAGGAVNAPDDYRGHRTGTAELYDPVAGTFSPTGPMTVARNWHTATLLQDGRVLVVGGDQTVIGETVITTAELYDPSTGRFSPTGSPVAGQRGATATLLKSGKVLIAGGAGWAPCCAGPGTVSNPELYDPATGTFTETGAFAQNATDDYNLAHGPSVSGAARLADGRVLLAAAPRSEIYDPATGQFSVAGAMATTHRFCHPPYINGRTLTVLGRGQVLLTGGGHEDCGRYTEVERFDPTSATFSVIGHLTHWRNWHTATVLPDGTVLIAGGEFTGGTVDTVDPSTGDAIATGAMGAGRSGHTATLLRDGRILIAGGQVYLPSGHFLGSLASAELYTPRRLEAPVPVFPAADAVTMDSYPRLQVHNVAASRRGTIVTYTFEWSTRSDFPPGSATAFNDAVAAGNGDDTTFAIPDALVSGTTYYWRARAVAALTEADTTITVDGEYSEVRTFHTPSARSTTTSLPARLHDAGSAGRHTAAAGPHGTSAISPSPAVSASSAARRRDERGRQSAPTDLVATASGSGVVLTWRAPAGAQPLRYAIAGATAGEASTLPVAVTPDVSTLYVITALASGTYQFWVYAVFPDGLSTPSEPAAVVAPGTADAEPATGAVATVSGAAVTVRWTPATTAALYHLEIGREPGRADIAVLTTTDERVTFRAGDHGTYYLRVKAIRGAFVRAPSNEVSVTAGGATCGAPPGAPVLLPISASGGAITFSWLPAAGAPAERYRVDVKGIGKPISLIASGTGSSLVARLDPGLYTANANGMNACGVSAASNAITFRLTAPSN